jgi:hypothetical protein
MMIIVKREGSEKSGKSIRSEGGKFLCVSIKKGEKR